MGLVGGKELLEDALTYVYTLKVFEVNSIDRAIDLLSRFTTPLVLRISKEELIPPIAKLGSEFSTDFSLELVMQDPDPVKVAYLSERGLGGVVFFEENLEVATQRSYEILSLIPFKDISIEVVLPKAKVESENFIEFCLTCALDSVDPQETDLDLLKERFSLTGIPFTLKDHTSDDDLTSFGVFKKVFVNP